MRKKSIFALKLLLTVTILVALMSLTVRKTVVLDVRANNVYHNTPINGASPTVPSSSNTGQSTGQNTVQNTVQNTEPQKPAPTKEQVFIAQTYAALRRIRLQSVSQVADTQNTEASAPAGAVLLRTGRMHSYSAGLMKEISEVNEMGHPIVFINIWENKEHVVLMEPGTKIDPDVTWFGPLYMSQYFTDITEEYEAQSATLSQTERLRETLRSLGYDGTLAGNLKLD